MDIMQVIAALKRNAAQHPYFIADVNVGNVKLHIMPLEEGQYRMFDQEKNSVDVDGWDGVYCVLDAMQRADEPHVQFMEIVNEFVDDGQEYTNAYGVYRKKTSPTKH